MEIQKNYDHIKDTSSFAYHATPEKVREQQRQLVLAKVAELGDATCEELEKCLDMKHQSVSALITRLLKNGTLVDTGKRRLTQSNRPARVYQIVVQDKVAEFFQTRMNIGEEYDDVD